MVKRMLDCTASELATYSKGELLESIVASEGRIIASESIGLTTPLLTDVTNAELASAMGADILLLNMFDVHNPVVQGLPNVGAEKVVSEIKRLTGRIVGINLEPVEKMQNTNDNSIWAMSDGRKATTLNAKKACKLGVDLIVLTGNPGNGVKNEAIVDSLEAIKSEIGDKVILAAGKMHASGILSESGENIITKNDVSEFISAGADIILLPAPGSVPGITVDYIRGLVQYIHKCGVLAMTAIGTSQEGSDVDTIKKIALWCKMTGTDIHHIGDAGVLGLANPENIFAYGVAIRGVRHTYHRMAISINR